jgi:hypothetical protein
MELGTRSFYKSALTHNGILADQGARQSKQSVLEVMKKKRLTVPWRG